MRVGGAEQHAFGNDRRGAAAGLEQPQKQRNEEKLGLLRLDDLKQILRAGFVIERSGKRWIGEDKRVLLFLARMVLRERVAIADVGFSTPCSSMFMLPMRSIVLSKSKP